MGQPLFCGISRRTFDLIVVVVQSSNMASCEFHHFSCRPTNAAADVKHFHSFMNANFMSHVVLMARNGLLEGFSVCETAEVKGLAPTIFIKVSYEVVITA